MSTKYYFEDPGVDSLFASFNQQLSEIHRKCLDMVAGMDVDPSLKDLKRELFNDLKASFMFDKREAFHQKFEIGVSTDKTFYWADSIGFDGLLSVQKFMNDHPRMVITDSNNEVVSFSQFREIVSPKEKTQKSLHSDKKINTKPFLDDLIEMASSQKARMQQDSFVKVEDRER